MVKILVTLLKCTFIDIERLTMPYNVHHIKITYNSPNETSRVRYLLNSIQCRDATVCAAKTTIQVDISKKDKFEQAVDFILITVPPPRNSNLIYQISAVNNGNNNGNRRRKFGGKFKTVSKTSVELRFHKTNE